ncbi:MAG: Ni/Fe hydrogenase subunit alpha [Anaerolineae bacterium]|nr:Ni/Fe hydrogenase subunit alpha [Anaerolineae bacterium]
MATLTFPLSRLEGHARVEIEVRDGEVLAARFQATEYRGFEYLVRGGPAEQMPVIVPRICGVCSTAHHVAAVRTLEDIYGVTPPPLAQKLRELLMLGQLLQNQATSLFLFTMPDRFGVDSLFDTGEATFRGAMPVETRTHALQVRQVGTHLIALAGGQFIHPVKAVVGGVTSGIDAAAAAKMREELEWALPVAAELFDSYWRASQALSKRLGTWGDDEPACYITSVGPEHPNYYGDQVRVLGCRDEGDVCTIFPASAYESFLTVEENDYSYALQTSYQGNVLRANSLARINLIQKMGTPRADGYLTRFHEEFGRPAHAILLFDLARGIELVYAIERSLEILSDPLDQEDTGVAYTPCDGEGYGLVEAPRGPLIHHYVVEDGKIARAEFIIPTIHNLLAIERALRVAARRYVTLHAVDLELERAVGRVVRAFDPCIACATH